MPKRTMTKRITSKLEVASVLDMPDLNQPDPNQPEPLLEPEPTLETNPQGRPRSQQAHKAVIQTTKSLLANLEYPAISVDRIVTESGVSKRTIYRWWPNKAAIILEAIASDDINEPDTGKLADDLTTLLTGIINRITGDPAAQAIRGLLADAQFDPAFAEVLRTYIGKRRQVCLHILERAKQRQELPNHANTEMIADLIYGPYWYRLLVGHAPLNASFARDLVRQVLDGALN
jgi:AcrR family transcriptional regulator